MFPLSYGFLGSLPIAFAFGAASLCFALAILWRKSMALLPILGFVAGFFWIVTRPEIQQGNGAGLIVPVYLSFAGRLFLISALWGTALAVLSRWVSRDKPKLWLVVVAAFLPTLAWIGYAFERQVEPGEACARDHLPVRIGGSEFRVFPEFGLRIDLTRPDRIGLVSALFYRPGVDRKEDRRKLCDLSARGRQPVDAVMFLWGPATSAADLSEACAVAVRERGYCSALRP